MAALAGSVSAAGQHLWEEHVIAEVPVRLKLFPRGVANLTHSQRSARWARTRLSKVCAAQFTVTQLMLACVLLTAGLVIYIMKRARPVYLLDYHVYKPADALKMPHAVFLKHTREAQVLNPRATRFATSMQHCSAKRMTC